MSTTNIIYLLKKDYYLYKKPIIYILLGLFFLTGFLLFITTEEYCNGDYAIDITNIIRACSIVGAWLLMAAGAFYEFRQDDIRKGYLLLPASTAEKWLVRWVEVTILFLLLVTLTTILAYNTFSHIITLKWAECEFVTWQSILVPIDIYDVDGNEISADLKRILIIDYITPKFLLHSLLFLLGIIFNKYGTIKSILSAVFLLSLLFLFSYIILNLFLDSHNSLFSVLVILKWRLLHSIIAMVLLVLSFLKLKHKQA